MPLEDICLKILIPVVEFTALVMAKMCFIKSNLIFFTILSNRYIGRCRYIMLVNQQAGEYDRVSL